MTLTVDPTDQISRLVSQVLKIDDVVWGGPGHQFHVRFRGRLRMDSIEAYDRLARQLRPLDFTTLFRVEGEDHLIILTRGVIRPTPSNPRINLILFLLTLFTVLLAGSLYVYEGSAAASLPELLSDRIANLADGIPFALSMLSILLAHEFGHYLAGRYHGTAVTLPYFIPLPFSPLGTLGALIQLKEPPKNRRVLLDIGAAGPLAGLVVAIPVLLIGLSLSTVEPIPSAFPPNQGISMEGNSVLYLLAKYAVFGELLPAPASYGDAGPLLHWIRYFFTGEPFPFGGRDVFIHSVAWAGWAGLLVTALNLIPAGQLDGGHLIYTLFGQRARALLPFILGGLLLLGLAWSGWWLWAALIFFFGRSYAEPLDLITELDPRRKAVALIGLALFVLLFTPVPLRLITASP